MIGDCCKGLGEGAANLIIQKDSKSIPVLFFFGLVLQNQKLLERIENSAEKKKNFEADDALFNSID